MSESGVDDDDVDVVIVGGSELTSDVEGDAVVNVGGSEMVSDVDDDDIYGIVSARDWS